ncbi:MAG: hypothetical protein ACREXS_10705 [Gammaproteobacteria bacterium]
MDRNNDNVRLEIAGFIILAIGFQPETFASPSSAGADHSTKARLVETYGKLPLSFEANQGQTGEQVRFLSRGPGHSVSDAHRSGAVAAQARNNTPKATPSPLAAGEGGGEGECL